MENNKISTDATRRFQDVGKIFCPTMFMDIDKLLTKKKRHDVAKPQWFFW